MTEPIVSTNTVTVLAGGAFFGFFVGVDAGLILGAFAGAIFFVVSDTEFTGLARVALGLISFIAGLIFSRPLGHFILTRDFMSRYQGNPQWIDVSVAFLISAFAILLLMHVKNNGVAGLIKLNRSSRGNQE